MLPVVVQALKGKREGPSILADFLSQARFALERRHKISQARRNFVYEQRNSRRERQSLVRYFDVVLQSQRAHQVALETLGKFLDNNEEHLLDEALRHYETGERYQKARIKMRMQLTPRLCDRLFQAC